MRVEVVRTFFLTGLLCVALVSSMTTGCSRDQPAETAAMDTVVSEDSAGESVFDSPAPADAGVDAPSPVDIDPTPAPAGAVPSVTPVTSQPALPRMAAPTRPSSTPALRPSPSRRVSATTHPEVPITAAPPMDSLDSSSASAASQQPLPPLISSGDPTRTPEDDQQPDLTSSGFTADDALRTYGSIAFNTPSEMTVEKSHVIQLLLDPSGISPSVLEKDITEPGTVDSARIRISDTVEARLTGTAFDVRPVTPELQAVSGEEPTEWRWEVIPKETGSHRLFLTINALVPSEGAVDRRRSIRTFDRTITVGVNRRSARSYLVPAAIALVIAAMVVIVFVDWMQRRKAGAAQQIAAPLIDISTPGEDAETIRDTPSPPSSASPRGMTRTLVAGEVVAGRYMIEELLGRGGMGAVYAARDRELGERVALKTMLPASAIDERSLSRFRREIQYARRVAHPNVCRIHDLGQHRLDGSEEALMFVSMELIDGVTLSSLLREKTRLTEAEALPIISQIAAGLDATHEAGLVHRDLKPANIMLSGDGKRVVLMDFGLARLSAPQEGELSITETGAIVGSPVYMAPEQLDDGDVGPATDIYAFGAVIYEMVTGGRPFDAESPISLIAKRLHGHPVPPSLRWPGISPLWERTILRCLARRPEDRFRTAGDVERSLRGMLTDEVTIEMTPEV